MEREQEGWLGLRRISEALWAQARADYATAVTLLDAGVYYASVFFSQQAAEKALKAASIDRLQKLPKSHNIVQMANNLGAPIEVMNAAAELNSEFLATRNPENSEGVPAQNYDKRSARIHIRCAQVIVDWIKAIR
ncbi:MAG: HEPN domain-containing protein [Armatimonadota bacterium]|nr:HEPN domain-containing protein [Armatimonadota bacterium]